VANWSDNSGMPAWNVVTLLNYKLRSEINGGEAMSMNVTGVYFLCAAGSESERKRKRGRLWALGSEWMNEGLSHLTGNLRGEESGGAEMEGRDIIIRVITELERMLILTSYL